MKPTDTNLAKVFKKTRKTIAKIRQSEKLFDKVCYEAMVTYLKNIEE
jgi:hypothetical protein